jgi:lipoate-protein ligase A
VREIKLLIDPPGGGAWNMAVDEELLEAAAANSIAVMRLYQWAPATLSLGYFQAAADRRSHAASQACPLVRRASGGGAILHDRELTYSLVLPQTAPQTHSATALYDLIHRSLIAALADLGVVATMHCPADGCHQATDNAVTPFLCFQRRSRGDILVGEHKIGGSAQRRRRGAVLQHGSILLARSPHAPELPGVEDLAASKLPRAAGENLPISGLIAAWLGRVRVALSAGLCDWTLPPSIDSLAREIMEARFGAAALTHQR